MKLNTFCIPFLLLICSPFVLYGQEDLMDLLDDESEEPVIYSTFKGSRIILGHSVETLSKKELEFLISHRFGRVNSGAHNFFGLDNAFVRLGLEYGVTDKLNIGIGRSSFDKSIDGFIKYKIISQQVGAGGFPFSLVFFNSLAIKTTPRQDDDPAVVFNDRLASAHQLLIARKINSAVSVQLMPVWVHKNTVNFNEKNDQLALGIGGRAKITKSLAVNVEYYYRIDVPANSPYTNSLAVGVDIETGGHVFQLHFTNSTMTIERSFITETSGDFFEGDMRFGFNISRTFQLGQKRSGG